MICIICSNDAMLVIKDSNIETFSLACAEDRQVDGRNQQKAIYFRLSH